MSSLAPERRDARTELAGWYQRSLRPRLHLAVARGAADPRQADELDRLLRQLLHPRSGTTRAPSGRAHKSVPAAPAP